MTKNRIETTDKSVCQQKSSATQTVSLQSPCRKLVATREIACGELICLDRPLNRGPKPSTRPVCLGCYLPLQSASALCPEGCGWPVCSADCPLLQHEHKNECEHFRRREFKVEVRTKGKREGCLARGYLTFAGIATLPLIRHRNLSMGRWSRRTTSYPHCVFS